MRPDSARAQIPLPADLVRSEAGGIPILITAPHGGRRTLPDIPTRRNGTIESDGNTLELATAISRHLADLMGARPSLVAALFHRRHVDVNRPAATAYEVPAGAPYYASYHAAVRAAVDRIRATYGGEKALFLDLHGQAYERGTIYRGTAEGRTVERLLARAGETALIGPASVCGGLAAAGYAVFPPNTPFGDPPELRRFGGGYTVRTYGSNNPDGIDAIQLEFGATLRLDAANRRRLARDLAEAIAAFAAAYLA